MIRDQQPYSVLIVEDNLGDYILISEYLNERFARLSITRTQSYAETHQLFSEKQVSFDVVLLDLSLPDKKGEALIRDVLTISNKTPVIVLTGYTDISFSIKSLTLGVSDYLLKEDIETMSLYKSIIYALERKKFITSLQESERKYSRLFHHSPQPKIVYDTETLFIVQVNQAAMTQYGYSEEELCNMRISDLCVEEDRERLLETLQHHETGITLQDSTNRFRQLNKNGQQLEVEIHSSVIMNEDKKIRLVMISDITEKVLFDNKMTQAILKTQEDERYEIGAELHDNVCQLLATSQLCMSLLEETLSDDVMEYYNQSQEMISMALKEIRNLSHQLAPVLFEDSTVEETMEILLRSFNVSNAYQIGLEIEPEVYKIAMPKEVHLTIFRIMQEQLRNIQKHAQASEIMIHARLKEQSLEVGISDNGVGFDLNSVRGGIGFSNMKRRMDLLSGKIQVLSAPSQGCTVKFVIPLDFL